MVKALRGDADAVMNFRTIAETEAAQRALYKLPQAERLIRRMNFRGSLSSADLREKLEKRQAGGYALYYTVNLTDGEGARTANMVRAVAIPLDLDGAPLPDEWQGGLAPHIIIESSPGRYQCIFKIKPTRDFAAVKATAKRVALAYDGDPSVIDTARVLRLAGSIHQKRAPFTVRIVEINDDVPHILADFDLHLPELPPIEEREPGEGIGAIDADKAERLLAALDPDNFASNDSWLELAMALHSASDADPDVTAKFMEWSRVGEYDDDVIEQINRNRWESFKADGGRGIGTLRHIAKREGIDPGLRFELFNTAVEDFDDVEEFHSDFDFDVPIPDDSAWLEGLRQAPTIHNSGRLFYQVASEIEPEQINWLWRGRIARGKINFIAGFPDQGKSQITCDIAARVTKGGAWPNSEGHAERATVIMLSAEDDAADTIVPRLMAAKANLSRVRIVAATVKTDGKGRRMFSLADDIAELTKLVKVSGDVGLVIIDPISAYMGAGGKSGADTFKNTEVRALLAPLAEWAAVHDIAVVFVSHFNKSNTGRALSRLTDSLAFGALARCGWMVVPEQDSDGCETGRKLFLRGKNNIAADAGGLAYEIAARPVTGGIEAPFVKWLGPVTTTADAALNPVTTKTTAGELAETFLEDELARGPVLIKDLKKLAESRSLNWRTVQRARESLGVVSTRKGFGVSDESTWSLSADSE
jgi:hypothetical protein